MGEQRLHPWQPLHRRTLHVMSLDTEINKSSPGKNAQSLTSLVWPTMLMTALAVLAAHTTILLSAPHEAHSVPRPLKASPRTSLLWPLPVPPSDMGELSRVGMTAHVTSFFRTVSPFQSCMVVHHTSLPPAT